MCGVHAAGSIKVIRVLVMLKLIGRGCVKRIHPRSVVAVKIGKNPISAPVVSVYNGIHTDVYASADNIMFRAVLPGDRS